MNRILIFAGTTEGRQLSERLCAAGVKHIVCVATEYGEIVLTEHPCAQVHRGRMDKDEMCQFILEEKCSAVVDATHPYASIVTENIKASVAQANQSRKASENAEEAADHMEPAGAIPYIRLKRETDLVVDYDNITYFPDSAACAKALEKVEGNILLTTGSKELAVYGVEESVKSRLYVRVLPSVESIRLCMEQGIAGKQILALQGPFGTALNEALIDQYEIRCMVTKKSGAAGGWNEKIAAAKNKNIPVYVIAQNCEEEGLSFREVCECLAELCRIDLRDRMKIVLVGTGMGNDGCLTEEAAAAIKSADIVFGANRLLEKCDAGIEKKPFYLAKQIIPCLKERKQGKAVILFSGDTGFYSGCRKLYQAIRAEIDDGNLHAELKVLPGISSVSYLAAALGESYSDAYICSIHGVKLANLTSRLSLHEKTFLLTSGVADVNALGAILEEDSRYGLTSCRVFAGYQLSYPEEKILELSPQECRNLREEGLYVCMIKNPAARSRSLAPRMRDEEFLRERVPMTKEEIRHISICKLCLQADSVLYDVGSGTGSIAVEAAALSEDLNVYAIEQKENAVALIRKNAEQFGLENIHIVHAKAPEGMDELPAPTHAFIGGSGGNLREILTCLREKNPGIRIVINAISMETIAELTELLRDPEFPVEADIVQLQASRAKQIGAYHLMQAENPVWICALRFDEETL